MKRRKQESNTLETEVRREQPRKVERKVNEMIHIGHLKIIKENKKLIWVTWYHAIMKDGIHASISHSIIGNMVIQIQ